MRLSPSERAAEDAARIKARIAKLVFIPGPGAYDPKFQDSSSITFAGSMSFKSQTQRDKTPPSTAENKTMGDPGQYSPELNQLAAQAKESFQVSSKTGHNFFGSKMPRVMKLEMGEETPGPDTYNADKATASNKIAMSAMTDKEKMPSSAFRSAGRKTTKVPQQDQPGPGAYNPNPEATMEALPGASMRSNIVPKSGREISLGGSDVDGNVQNATSAITGPGSYDNHTAHSISRGARKKFERMSRSAATEVPGTGALGFDSRAAARDLPHEKPLEKVHSKTPGPGVYNPEASVEVANEAKKTFNAKAKHGSSGFLTTAPLGLNARDGRDMQANDAGDPGTYNPNANRVLAHDAKKTFQTSYKAGKGAFGSTHTSMTKRVMQLDIMGEGETPGPDAYNADKATASTKIAMSAMDEREKMPSSAFRSAGRKTTKVPQQDQPGPGAYNPNPEATMEALPGASMRSNIVPKSGREISLGGSDVDSNVQNATSAITGPGSYDPRSTNDGERNTIEARVEVKAETGWSAYFISDSIREMFTSLISDDITKRLWQMS